MNRYVCSYLVPDVNEDVLPDFVSLVHAPSRADVMTAIGTVEGVVLLIDLDDAEANEVITEALEIKPRLAIIGLTGSNDLNRVLTAQRLGVRQIARRPVDADDLAAALIEAWKLTADDITINRTFGVIGTTGGAGTTTIACNLTAELARTADCQVAVIDLDLEFGGVARAFDISPRFTVAELAAAGAADTVLLHKTAVETSSRACVIARPPNMRNSHFIDANSVRRVIKLAKRAYPFVVLDLPRRLDETVGAAMEMCDKLLIVLQLTVPGVDNARRLIEAFSGEGVPQSMLEIVVNRYRKNVHACTPEAAERELGQKIFATVPNDFQAVNHAIDTGKPLEQRNAVRAAIADMAAKLAGKPPAVADKKGWLASLGIGRS